MDQVKNFVYGFFENLKCDLKWEKEKLIVNNIPERFEKFFGKKSPYKIVFSREENDGSCEVAVIGSYLIKAIKNYLEDSGKTTLLKINFQIDPEEEIKKHIHLKNSRVEKLVKKFTNNFFTRFTFQSNFMYLNKNEKVLNHIFVHNGEIIYGDLDEYEVSEGDSRDVSSENIKRDYNSAKEEIKRILQGKTKEISKFLEIQLEKEILRIQKHFAQIEVEGGEGLVQNMEKIKFLEGELGKNPEEDDKIKERISRIQKIVENLQEKGSPEKFDEEKDLEIASEKNKHSLNIGNKLINTTVIYYPIYTFDVFLKNEHAGRIIELSFNPLTKELNPFFCECCKEEIKEITLCSSGHISCDKCMSICADCNKQYCKDCLSRSCSVCGRDICKNCTCRCISCGQVVCKGHAKKDHITGRHHCVNCLKRCTRCHEYKDPKYFRISPIDRMQVCGKCASKEVSRETLKKVFSD